MNRNSSTASQAISLFMSSLEIIGLIQLYYRSFDQLSQHMINGLSYIIQ